MQLSSISYETFANFEYGRQGVAVQNLSLYDGGYSQLSMSFFPSGVVEITRHSLPNKRGMVANDTYRSDGSYSFSRNGRAKEFKEILEIEPDVKEQFQSVFAKHLDQARRELTAAHDDNPDLITDEHLRKFEQMADEIIRGTFGPTTLTPSRVSKPEPNIPSRPRLEAVSTGLTATRDYGTR